MSENMEMLGNVDMPDDMETEEVCSDQNRAVSAGFLPGSVGDALYLYIWELTVADGG
ncbi:MAG: hypothetical protein H0U72_11040 [Nitrosospira sp.]|nr:hypothetical protein [Nitrosospira sp.]